MRHRISLLLILFLTLLGGAAHTPTRVVAQNCTDEAELVEQTLDPASANLAPDASFTVEWTLRNSGDCTWDRTYRLIFVEGERMDSPRTTRLRSSVEPGETLTLALDLTAPSDADAYSGTWQLRNPGGDNFGPELTLDIEVGAEIAAAKEVVLPEVLAFGGMGAGDDPYAISYCVVDGVLSTDPSLVIDYEALEYSYTSLYICSLPEGTEVTIEVTDPAGNTFTRDFVEDAAVTGTDFDGNEYTGTVLQVSLTFLSKAPRGDWGIVVTSAVFEEAATLTVPEVPPSLFEGEEYPMLDNWPIAPIDPFSASGGCHYNYMPAEEMRIGGEFLPANTTLQIGFYHSRMGAGYLVDQVAVQTDDIGSFEIPYVAFTDPGDYNLVILEEVNPEGYAENGTEYDFGFGSDESAFSCYSVVREANDLIPWRLAMASGDLGNSEILVLDMDTGIGYYPTFTNDNCDASEPAWWPDGVWVLYQSNCERDESSEFIELTAREDYDLYAVMIDPTYLLPEEETLLRLTVTPELHETEADANADGLIVYRQTPVGDSLDESGNLSILDVFEETDTPLGLWGRAPTWSPDGTRIAFMSDLEGTWQIYVYDYVEDEVWPVSDGCATHCRLPAWSPDGKQVIYHVSASLEDFTPTALWIATVDGNTQPRRYLSGEYGRPSWSNEGYIAFQGPGGIYRAAPSRLMPTPKRYLYSDPATATLWSPVWSR